MAYRVECKKTVREAIDNLVEFLSNPISMETNYELAQGNGNIENIAFNPDTVQTETWELRYDGANNVFKVTGSVSGAKDDAQIDQPYDNGIIKFTIRQGDKVWQDGDIVTIDVKKGSAKPMRVLANYLENTLESNKAWIGGSYGYHVTFGPIGDNSNIYKFAKKKDKVFFQGGGNFLFCKMWSNNQAPYRNVRIYCDSINPTSHKLSSDVTIVLTGQFFELIKGQASSCPHINRMYIYNYTSDYYTSERTVSIYTNLNDGKLYFEDEVLCNIGEIVKGKGIVTLAITLNNTEGKLSVYIDGVKVVDNLQNDKWKNFKGLFGKQIDSPIYTSGYYVWNRILTEEEIKSFDKNGFPPKELNDFYVSILNNTGLLKNIILQINKNGFLQLNGDKFIFYNTIELLGKIEDYLQSLNSDCFDISIDRWNRYGYGQGYNIPFIDNISFYMPKLHWGKQDEMIEKYWYVTDGTDVLIVLKKFDPALVDDPTYQIFYFGWGEGDRNYDLPFALGWGGNNAYDVNNNDFRFGLMYRKNTSFWNGTSWVNNYVEDGALSGDWQEIKNDNQSISIIKVNKYKNIADNLKIINFGSPKWLYLINFVDIEPETEVYIDGKKHIVIPDNHIKVPYNYLIELNEE